MITKFINYINEVHLSELDKIQSDTISNSFTISLEIELETDDKSGSDKVLTENQIDKVINLIKDKILVEIPRFNNFNPNKFNNYKEFLSNLLDEIRDNLYTDDEYIDEILEYDTYENDIEAGIVQLVDPLVQTYFYGENIFYLKNKLKSNLPEFWKKWKSKIKYEIDNTLERGIEISMKTYILGIENTIEFIDDFYSDFDNQKYWKFKETTGIHINIGLNYKSTWNIIKGLLILNDTQENPFLFRGMEWRKNTKFTNSILKSISDLDTTEKENIIQNIDLHNLSKSENFLNDFLFKLVKRLGYKNFGFNITTTLNDNYVEFRYPGGKISKNVLIEKLLYFCYIIYCMTNPEFKKKEYQKKIYKFLDKLSDF
jgi:hypothetical protein